MKKLIIILLLFYGGFLNAQIVPCISNTMKRYNEKIDSVYVKNDTLYVLDSFSRLTKYSLATAKKDTTYSKLLFVDPINGSDVTGTGSDNNMFKTITKALSVADNSGYRIVLAAGTYNESPTISKLNIDLVTVAGDIRGNTFINGTVTVSNASSSVGIDGLSINNVVNTGAGSLYINNSTINTQLTKSGAGYLEVRNSQLQTTSTSTISNGTALIQDNLISNLTVSGASTGVTAKDNVIDVLGALTYSGGFYSVQNNTGNVVTTSATNIELGLVAQGVPSATAKNYVTNYSNKLAMINPDSVSTSSNVVVWSNATKRLEITKFPTQIDTTSLSNRINQKVSYTDTASMLLPYLRKNDTISLSNRIDKKLDSVWYKSDTLFVKSATGTTSYPQTKYVDSIYQNTAKDSLFWNKNGVIYGYKLGGGSTQDTTSWFYRLRQLNDSTVVYDRKNGTSDTVRFTYQCCGGGSSFDTSYIYSILNKKVDTIYTNSTKDTIFYTRNGVITKFPIGGASASPCSNVYFNGLDPATSTIFDTVNPPVTNIPSLKNLDCATYISAIDGSFWTSDGTTYKTKVYNVPLHQRDLITATASQITFTLTKVPIGGTEKVHVTRNGVDISNAWTWAGNVGTYIPASNGSKVMDAGDIIRFHYEAY